MSKRSGYMKRHHPVGRILDPLVQLAGGFLLYVPEGACGGEREGWIVLLFMGGKDDPSVRLHIPISSTPDEARALLAKGVGEALGR